MKIMKLLMEMSRMFYIEKTERLITILTYRVVLFLAMHITSNTSHICNLTCRIKLIICYGEQLCTRIHEVSNAETKLRKPKAKHSLFDFSSHAELTQNAYVFFSVRGEPKLLEITYLVWPHTKTNSAQNFNYLRIKIDFTVVTSWSC